MQNNSIKEYVNRINKEFVSAVGGSYVKLNTGEIFTETEVKKYVQIKMETFTKEIMEDVKRECHDNGIEIDQRLINQRSVDRDKKNKKKLNKTKERYDNGEFNIVYRKNIEGVIFNMKLTSSEKLVFLSLRDFVQYPTNCVVINDKIPDINQLEKITSLKERTIISALKSLEEKGLIKRKQSGHRKSIYINPEYYASGKDLNIETLEMFGLIECDNDKINYYLKEDN